MVSEQLLYPLIERLGGYHYIITEELTKCRNWRGITILSKRLWDYILLRLRNEQAVFDVHRSGVDHVNTLQIIVE